MISKIQFRLQFLVLLWGFTGVFGKLVTMNALPMVWYRVLIAAIAIGIGAVVGLINTVKQNIKESKLCLKLNFLCYFCENKIITDYFSDNEESSIGFSQDIR